MPRPVLQQVGAQGRLERGLGPGLAGLGLQDVRSGARRCPGSSPAASAATACGRWRRAPPIRAAPGAARRPWRRRCRGCRSGTEPTTEPSAGLRTVMEVSAGAACRSVISAVSTRDAGRRQGVGLLAFQSDPRRSAEPGGHPRREQRPQPRPAGVTPAAATSSSSSSTISAACSVHVGCSLGTHQVRPRLAGVRTPARGQPDLQRGRLHRRADAHGHPAAQPALRPAPHAVVGDAGRPSG